MTENTNHTDKPSEEKITIIEKNLNRTNIQRIKDTLCLFFPIAAAFAGCFLTDPIWNIFCKNKTAPELLKFGAALLCFALSSSIVFILTRKINPIMKIGIFSSQDKSKDLNV